MVYLDTSVVVPLLTPEASSDAVAAWFADLRELPVSSDWLLAEFASALSIKARTGQITSRNVKAVRSEFERLASSGLRLAPVSRTAFVSASELAGEQRHGLRAGDALHLAVALELGALTVATLDTAMAENARRLGMDLVRFDQGLKRS